MSGLEATLLFQIRARRLPEPVVEYRFDPSRRWRFDLAWPARRLAVECEGGVWTGGRHIQGAGFTKDCEKYNTATVQGWRVLRFTGPMIRSGQAVEVVARALGAGRTVG